MSKFHGFLALSMVLAGTAYSAVPGTAGKGNPKKVLIVAVNPATAKHLPRGLRDKGIEPVFILDQKRRYEGESRTSLASCQTNLVDLKDPDAVQRLLDAKPGILRGAGAITTFQDDRFPMIEKIAARHALRGPDHAVAKLANKIELYRLVPEYCPKSWTFTAATAGALDFGSMQSRTGWVLKPSLSCGAAGVQVLSPDTSLDQVVPQVVVQGEAGGFKGQTWILQERIHGRLLSLEGFVHKGQIRFLGFSMRTRLDLTEVVNEFPADGKLPESVKARCRDAVQQVVARSGYHNGYFHCEFLMDGDRSWLIDGNLGRIAGGAYLEQIALSFGLSPSVVAAHVALLPLYPETTVSPYQWSDAQRRDTLNVSFGVSQPSTILRIEFPAKSPCFFTQFAACGSRVPGLGATDWAWVGGVSGLRRDVVNEVRRIVVHTPEGPVAPHFVLEEKVAAAITPAIP